MFGVGYAVASLACTFGVLLAVIAQAQAATGFAGQAVVFAAYATGAGTVLLALSAAAALTGAVLGRAVAALGRWQARITAVLLVVTGGYVALYWWPAVARGSATGRGLAGVDHWSAAVSSWLQQHVVATAGVALLLVAAVGVGAVIARLPRSRDEPATNPDRRMYSVGERPGAHPGSFRRSWRHR